ncbi:MAG: tyrosine-type recombinase/integrase [Erythrobacter sp.]|nr:MAG: tyrosine-type recombinase/integrase [Erythrobacter sp.]
MTDGLHFVRIRGKGKLPTWYVYAWRGGPRICRVECRTKPRLNHEHLAKLKEALDGRHQADPTTLRSLIREWRSESADRPSSPEWESLAKGTKKTWGSALNMIEAKWGDVPLSVWDDPRMVAKVVAWRDSRSATPRGADIGVTTLRALLEFGRLRGRVSINAASKIPALYRNGQRAEIIWTNDDMQRFALVAARCDKKHVSDGMRLAALTGLRRADLVTLEWSHVSETAIRKKALKSSRRKRQHVTVPIIPALASLLSELRALPRKDGVDTVLVNSLGQPWSSDGFGGSFNRVRDEAQIVFVDTDTGERKAKHLHDLRGTFCTRLLTEAGLNDEEAASVMGWSTNKVASIRRVYVDQGALIASIGARMAR